MPLALLWLVPPVLLPALMVALKTAGAAAASCVAHHTTPSSSSSHPPTSIHHVPPARPKLPDSLILHWYEVYWKEQERLSPSLLLTASGISLGAVLMDMWSAIPDSLHAMALRIASAAALTFAPLLHLPASAIAPAYLSGHIPSLLNTSIHELATLLDAGTITSHDLTLLYIQRIHEVNDDLHAVIEISPDALAIAAQLDRDRAASVHRGPLFGIPILIKDNYGTTDSMKTGAGSVFLATVPTTVEATVVKKLRDAGAVILGKANADEFSGARGFNVTARWSPRGGQTLGAYVAHQTPCGSSCGSGVAASLGLAAAALGTETAGSITCPAAYNNVVGIKPTVGTTSRHGVVPVTIRQDTTGPLAPSVADAALVLDAIAGIDPLDNYTSAQPWDTPPTFYAALDKSPLRGRRLGVVWLDFNPLSPSSWLNRNQTKAVFDATRPDLEAAGAELVDVSLFLGSTTPDSLIRWIIGNMTVYGRPDLRDGLEGFIDTMAAEVDNVRDLKSLVECVQTDPREQADRYGYETLEMALAEDEPAGSAEVWEAYLAASGMTRALVVDLLKEHKLDALVLLSDLAELVGASAGLPIVTIPMGSLGLDAQTEMDRTNTTVASAPGMPLGLSFMGDQWSDVELVSYGYAYEQVSKKRMLLKPYLQPQTDLGSGVGKNLGAWR